MSSLIGHLRASFSAHADRKAVEGAGWVLTYRDLDHEVGRLAAVLRKAGLRRGDLVPMLMGRSPQFVVALLAVLRCGAAYVPIDQSSPPSRQQAMMEGLASPVALTDTGILVAAMQRFQVIDVGQALLEKAPSSPPGWPELSDEAPAYAMFTSGSTGTPKGVVVPHRGIDRLVWEPDYLALGPDARWGQLSSIAFDASTLEIWAPLLHGGCCVVQEDPLPPLDALADFIAEKRLTDIWLTSALFNVMVDDWLPALGGLRQLLTGGERVSPTHAAACLDAHPGLRLINGYGPTENTTFSLCHTITPDDVGRGEDLPIGIPIRGTDILIVGGDGHPVVAGESGELWVGGRGVALGYLNDEGLTREKFVVRDGNRWYRTGDRVSLRADGRVAFLGRTDRQVKIQGHRIELDEVERVLGACPGVGAVAVLVAGNDAELRHLVGFVSGQGEVRPDGQEVFSWLETRLPPVMIPHALHVLDQLPVNLNGKVDRYALAARLTEGQSADSGGGRLPAPGLETALAEIWSRCFARQGQPIPIRADSSFIELGGTSLLALRVAAEIRSMLGRDFAPVDVLRHPQLAEQALRIDRAPRVEAGTASSLPGTGIPLGRGALAVLAASALDPSACAYLVHQAIRFQPPVTARAVRKAFVAVAARHPMLRACIPVGAPPPMAAISPELPAGWWTERGRLAEPPRDLVWPAEILQVINRPLNLAHGSSRVDSWSLADGGLLVVWTTHHYAIDEASANRVMDELAAAMTGGTHELPPVYGSPHGFPVVEQAWLDDVAVETKARDFARVACGLPLPLPPSPAPGDERPLSLAEDLVRRVRTWCAQSHCTPFLPLLVACGLALQDSFGPGWRHVLTPFSRRCEPELMEPVGYLLDLRLVEAGARDDESLTQVIRRVNREIMDAQKPRFQSAERIAEALGEIAPEAGPALFQFGLTWRQRPKDARRFGAVSGQPVAVPQRGARFSLCLHLSSDGDALEATVEAVRDAFSSGAAAAFGSAFVRRLKEVTGMVPPDLSDPAQDGLLRAGAGGPAEAAPQVRRAARAAWEEVLGRPPAGDDDDFLAAGGTSLLALRLAAGVRRHAGLELDVGGFLARPSFAGLCRHLGPAGAGPTGRKRMYSILGPADYGRFVLALPGHHGTAVSMFKFSNELRQHLGADHAVAMVDLDAIVRQAPIDGVLHFVREQLLQVVRDLGEDRLDSVVGASLGGLLGGHLLASLSEETAARVPLCMVDTYAPRALRVGNPWRWKKWAVRLALHPAHNIAYALGTRTRRWFGTTGIGETRSPLRETPWTRQAWDNCFDELAKAPFRVPRSRTVLIHSRPTRRVAGILRWAATNGFSGREFDDLRVVNVDLSHAELFHHSAGWVAAAIRTP